jgi:hypothetical protein
MSLRKELTKAIAESEIFVCCLTDLYCKKVESEEDNYCAFEFEWASTHLKAKNMLLLVLEEDMKTPEKRSLRIQSEFPRHLHLDMTKWHRGNAEKEACLSQLITEISKIRAIQKSTELS